MHAVSEIFRQAFLITGFVFVMMLVVEYVNVLTSGRWLEKIASGTFSQYFLCAILGAVPGCLGSFAVVAMYSHRVISLGAVIAAMVATAGDASFVMFSLVPQQALALHGLLLALAVPAGIFADLALGRRLTRQAGPCSGLELHAAAKCDCFPYGRILNQWRRCSPVRGVLAAGLTLFFLAVLFGGTGHGEWDWVRWTMLAAAAMALFITAVVPDHFLEEHLFAHIARKHVPRIFFWTLGALAAVHFIVDRYTFTWGGETGQWVLLTAACVIGLIPDSGPQIIFVTLFVRGAAPFSVLLANSIVQDGHGMLPLLAHSRRAVIGIKALKFVMGFGIGVLGIIFGY
jgi:hypothetical protein